MFAKVVHGVKRRPPGEPREESRPQHSNIQGEQLPPKLVRWSDFKDPFPALSPGAYRKYYMVYGSSIVDDSPSRKPLLSCTPEHSSSTGTPEKSVLFSPNTPVSPHRLTIIHETSMETMRVERAGPTIGRSPPNSLRRRRRQVLRTPSVERDFAVIARLVFTHPPSENISLSEHNEMSEAEASHSSCETSSTTTHTSHSSLSDTAGAPLSPISTTISQSSESSDSEHSDTSPSDLVITPLTSVGDVLEDQDDHPQKEVIHVLDPREPRPDSWCSFSTARSDFFEI